MNGELHAQRIRNSRNCESVLAMAAGGRRRSDDGAEPALPSLSFPLIGLAAQGLDIRDSSLLLLGRTGAVV